MTPRLSLCCMTGGAAPARLASILSLFRPVADEIVVAVEETRALETFAAVAGFADRVLTYPATAPADRPIPWLFDSCRGRWILNVDDDEVPSPRLLALIPTLVERSDITHAWIARRWLYPDPRRYLAQAPWSNEFQLRLVRADARSLQYSDVFHRPVIAQGPGAFVDAPLWHLDTAINPIERRRAKADAYERERPGMRVSGVAHNYGLYLPEMQPEPALAPVPEEDACVIARVLAGDTAEPSPTQATLVGASSDEVDRCWPGAPYSGLLHRGVVSVTAAPRAMRAGVQETIDVHVRNDGDRVWRWGKDARPEIRLGYNWTKDGVAVDEPAALRTVLPADLHPGESQLVPLHVVPPPQPGSYTLELELLHEGARRFGLSARLDVDVDERATVALIGEMGSITRTISDLELAPHVEPVIVLGNESDRSVFGDYPTVSGLRSSLLAGLELSGRATRTIHLSTRTVGILRAARRYRRRGTCADPALAGLFEVLRSARGLLVCSIDWPADGAPGREWWRLLTTMRACRALGTPVHYADTALPVGAGVRDAVVRRTLRSLATPLRDAHLPRHAPIGRPAPVPAELHPVAR